MSNWIPPGGFAGFAQSTPAMVQNARNAGRGTGTVGRKRRKSRKKKAAGVKRARRRRSTKKTAKRFVKGSAAAKRFMANLRKKRRK